MVINYKFIFINGVIFLALIFLLIYALARRERTALVNLRKLASLLHAEVEYPFLNLPIIQVCRGTYKERRVEFVLCLLSGETDTLALSEFTIQPLRISRDRYRFIGFKPNIVTPKTQLSFGNKIRLMNDGRDSPKDPKNFCSIAYLELSETDLQFFLDELTRAAEIVEKT